MAQATVTPEKKKTVLFKDIFSYPLSSFCAIICPLVADPQMSSPPPILVRLECLLVSSCGQVFSRDCL